MPTGHHRGVIEMSADKDSGPRYAPRSTVSRESYLARRYMQFLSREELEQRCRDIFVNMFTLDEGKIGILSHREGGARLMELHTHLLEEFKIRFGPFPAGFSEGFLKKAPVPDPTHANAARACLAVKNRNVAPGSFFTKFGNKEHLRAARERGVFRISPASSYGDPSLNAAVGDDELRFGVQLHPDSVRMEVLQKDGSRHDITPSGPVTFMSEVSSDYYVFCLATALVPRLFLDFDADACLIIRDIPAFHSRFRSAIRAALPSSAEWDGRGSLVRYVDPLNATMDDAEKPFVKHFRYTYQGEFRYAYLPVKPTGAKLAPFFIEMGDLAPFCELISLDVE